jgi:cell wall-associated NlpC family hydrolase
MAAKNPITPKKRNPIRTIQRAQTAKESLQSKEVMKETLLAAVKRQVLHVLANIFPYTALIIAIIVFIAYAAFTSQSFSQKFMTTSTGCMSQESVIQAKDGLNNLPDNAEYQKNLDRLNQKLSEVGFCNGYSPLPEGVSGGVYYDQVALNDTIQSIKKYIDGHGGVPDINEVISTVVSNIENNSVSGLTAAQKTKKEAQVTAKLNSLYDNGSTSKNKWASIVTYLEGERGATLWKANIGTAIAAAVEAKVGLPYVFGARDNWTGTCYKGDGGCGFDCSSLAGYGAAVGNGKLTGINKTSKGSWIEAGNPYGGTVNTLVAEAASGRWSFISSSEIAPGDFVVLSNAVESNSHVATFVGQDDKGNNLYVEAPRPGSKIVQRQAWWAGYNLTYIRPYDTIKF